MRKAKKFKLKEYNAYELRFLQILIPKNLYADLLRYNYNLLIERFLWKGDSVKEWQKTILGHPDDKLTFIQTRKPRPDLLDEVEPYLWCPYMWATKDLPLLCLHRKKECIKENCSLYNRIKAGEFRKTKELDAAGDYLEAITHSVAAFKKHGIPKGKVIWSDKLKPVIVRPDFIALDEEKKNEQQ